MAYEVDWPKVKTIDDFAKVVFDAVMSELTDADKDRLFGTTTPHKPYGKKYRRTAGR